MEPTLRHGQIVLATGLVLKLKIGDIVICQLEEKEIIKRISLAKDSNYYLMGDNSTASTDSRHFGWANQNDIVGKVIFKMW